MQFQPPSNACQASQPSQTLRSLGLQIRGLAQPKPGMKKAETSNMEIGRATLPLTHTRDGAVHTTKPEGVFSMDEYIAEHAVHKAAKPAIKPGVGPVAVGARSSRYTIALHEKYQSLGMPQPLFTFGGSSDTGWNGEVSFPGLDEDLQGIRDETIYSSKQEAKEGLSERTLEILARLEKVGRIKKVKAARTRASRYTVALYAKHQKLGIPQPFFTYNGSTELGWSAKVSFPGLEVVPSLKDEGRHPNKQRAKEALSERALEALEYAEQQGTLGPVGNAKGVAQQESKEKAEPGPNYLGQLLEFQRSRGAAQPTYEDYAVGTRFTCLARIDSDGTLPETFGSLDSLHGSKKAARQEAARYAVEYFKTQGRWPDSFSDVGGIKKKQKPQPDLSKLMSSTPALASSDSRQTNIASSSPGNTSYAQQVAHLASILSLSSPEWRFTPSLLDRGFYTIQCFFNSAGPHQGPIGEVRNVFSKKKAKEECARLTLDYLRGVHENRMAYGQKMMQGIGGGEIPVEGALGKPRDGEKVALEEKRHYMKELGGQSDEEMEFEDAVEEL